MKSICSEYEVRCSEIKLFMSIRIFSKIQPCTVELRFQLYRMLTCKCVFVNTCSESLLNSVGDVGNVVARVRGWRGSSFGVGSVDDVVVRVSWWRGLSFGVGGVGTQNFGQGQKMAWVEISE